MTKSKHKKSVFSALSFETSAEMIRGVSENREQSLRQLALHSRIHPSYLSRVLAGYAALSLAQAFRIASTLQLTLNEREYFLLLVQFDSSDDQGHRTFLKTKLNDMKNEQLKLETLFAEGENPRKKSQKSEQEIASYYQHVLTAKVHMHLLLTKYRTNPDLIASKLGISSTKLNQELRHLESLGIVTYERGAISKVTDFLHLDALHPASIQNHINWRLDCIQRLTDRDQPSLDYNFSGAFTANESVREAVKKAFKEFVLQTEHIVSAAQGKEDRVLKMTFDLY